MKVISNKAYTTLASLFSSSFLDSVFNDTYQKRISNALHNAGLQADILDGEHIQSLNYAYGVLQSGYRCEYLYKNAIANDILLNRHSIHDSLLLTEFRSVNSKADIVIFNGTSTVYEIKTELDNLDRLSTQLDEYLMVFDKVYVVTHQKNFEKLKNSVHHSVGILVLTESFEIVEHKKAKSNKKFINLSALFDSLRRTEYESIIKKVYGKIPDVPNTLIYQECKELFVKISPVKAHDLVVKTILQNRKLSQEQKTLIEAAPTSLKMLFLSKEFRISECQRLNTVFTC